MRIVLHVWRQANANAKGRMVRYEVNINEHMSFLEMLDVLNEDLIAKGEEPVAFDHDCREGICGMCGAMVNGVAHGPLPGTTLCQLHMRHFKDGDELNQSLEKAGRVADFFELAELMCLDALERNESCGGHFREEYQTPDGEALRDDEAYSYTAAWAFRGVGNRPELFKEPLTFEYVHPAQRSYK